MESTIFLGCSRGLGHEVLVQFGELFPEARALLIARDHDRLRTVQAGLKLSSQVLSVDLAKEKNLSLLLGQMDQFQPQRIFYFAGGGCYGPYAQKAWKDHFWGIQLSLLTPARILHHFMDLSGESQLKQMIFVGSAVADNQGDLHSASYAAAKHGLRGLIASVQLEQPHVDIRLFRPGYMDTGLLPPNATPRRQGLPIADPRQAASQFMQWALDPDGPKVLTL
jgi:short-subunit dehydrogenase